jgi:hypothetical protein
VTAGPVPGSVVATVVALTLIVVTFGLGLGPMQSG